MNPFLNYLTTAWPHIMELLWEHIELTVIAVSISILIGVPLGILIAKRRPLQAPVLQTANIMQAIPSMALLGFAIPIFGIGRVPAVLVVIIYSLLPIIKNTYTGLTQISPDTKEVAVGIGLSPWQVLHKVEFPLALPVIMAGIRISAVTSVGLMTIAAFIGAGGLGDLVFAGIRTVDNNMILAGAIPACLLALAVDYLLGLVEELVTPMATLITPEHTRAMIKKERRRAKWLIGLVTALLIIGAGTTVWRNYAETQSDITVGSKDFTEGVIMAHLMADMIEDRTDLRVTRHTNLGGTQVAYEALKTGGIDLYMDYTGTVYVSILRHEPLTDVDEVYRRSRDELATMGIMMLPQYSFDNTYALAVRQDTAERYRLQTMSDLIAAAPHLVVGSTFEFTNRKDGLPGLTAYYGMNFAGTTGLDGSSRYIALLNDDVQVVDAYTTDGLVRKFNLVALVDDRHYFPPYFATPLLRTDAAEKHPEVIAVLNELGSHINNQVAQDLNYKVDEEQQDPAKVAREFLKREGLLHKLK